VLDETKTSEESDGRLSLSAFRIQHLETLLKEPVAITSSDTTTLFIELVAIYFKKELVINVFFRALCRAHRSVLM
jgi:hypothetical protein